MKEFVTAAKESLGDVDEENVTTFIHDGREVTFFEPSTGQAAIMMTMTSRELDVRSAGTFIELMFSLMDEPTQRYFQTRLLDRKDPFDVDGDTGLVAIFEELSKEWSARPTKQPSDYAAPRRATGKASTASTRAKAKTSSPSRSRASSR